MQIAPRGNLFTPIVGFSNNYVRIGRQFWSPFASRRTRREIKFNRCAGQCSETKPMERLRMNRHEEDACAIRGARARIGERVRKSEDACATLKTRARSLEVGAFGYSIGNHG